MRSRLESSGAGTASAWDNRDGDSDNPYVKTNHGPQARPALLGAHCTAGAANNFGIDRAVELGCECVQIFGSNKVQWAARRYAEDQIESFRTARARSSVGPMFSHAIYLINLGARDENPGVYERSVESLVGGLRICDQLGLDGLIVHVGSNYGRGLGGVLDSVVQGLREARARSECDVPLILENTAGNSRLIGGKFEDFAAIFDELDGDPRLAVCVDTAHAFARGYDLASDGGLDQMLEEIEAAVGLARVKAVHLNDSKVECGRNLDRHENLGEGHIGYEGLAQVLREPKLRGVPAILETPGFDGEGPDRGNMEIMRALAGESDEAPEAIARRAKRRVARCRAAKSKRAQERGRGVQ